MRGADGTTTEWRSATVAPVSAPDGAGRRSDSRGLSGRHQYPPDQGGVGAAAPGRAAVEGRGVAAGGPAARGLRHVAHVAIWPTRISATCFIDGWFPKVRIGGRRARVPVLVTLGVRADGAAGRAGPAAGGGRKCGELGRGRHEPRSRRHLRAAGARGHRRQSGAADGAARAVAGHRDPTVHGAQAPKPRRRRRRRGCARS